MQMMVDSCVILDVITHDPKWYGWSTKTIERAMASDLIAFNAVIFAEVSVRFDSIDDFEMLFPRTLFEYHPIPREAAFLAGKCFARYRRRGGQRTVPLPDFFIGAHAMVLGVPLATRDPRRFREYFPKLEILCP